MSLAYAHVWLQINDSEISKFGFRMFAVQLADQMIHDPQEVVRKFRMVCGIRRCGEQGEHRYKEFAEKALKGISGFKKIYPNLLISTWESFPFVRNTKNKLSPIKLSMLVDLNKRSEGAKTRRPQQIVPNQRGSSTFYPIDHRVDAMDAKKLKTAYSSHDIQTGIQIGRDPDDVDELETGTPVWITNTPFNVEGRHFTGLKTEITASYVEKAAEETNEFANLAGNIRHVHAKDCILTATTHMPFTRSDLYHENSKRPVRLDPSAFDVKAEQKNNGINKYKDEYYPARAFEHTPTNGGPGSTGKPMIDDKEMRYDKSHKKIYPKPSQ